MKAKFFKKSITAFGSLFVLTSCGFNVNRSFNANANNINFNIINSDHVLTFDENGGVLTGNKTLKINEETEFKDLQDKPTAEREGSISSGWYYLEDGNQIDVTDSTKFTKNTTLYAKWKFYNVTFDSNTGYFDGTTSSEIVRENKIRIRQSDAPIAHKAGAVFDGWYDEPISGEKIVFPYNPNENKKLYAHYKVPTGKKVTLAIYAGEDGHFSEGNKTSKIIYKKVDSSETWGNIKSTISTPEVPDDVDKLFYKWQLNTQDIDDSTTFDCSTMINATYETAIQIIFDANGGKWSNDDVTRKSGKIRLSESHTFGDFVNKLSENPALGDTEFLNWYSDNKAVTLITKDEEITQTTRVYAFYKTEYTPTFNGSNFDAPTTDLTYIRNGTKEYKFIPHEGFEFKNTSKPVLHFNEIYTDTSSEWSVDEDGNGALTITNCPADNMTIDVTPQSKTIKSVTISKQQTTTKFIDGEPLDVTGLELLITYEDEGKKTVTPDDADFSCEPAVGSILTEGASTTQTITYSYKGSSVQTTITVQKLKILDDTSSLENNNSDTPANYSLSKNKFYNVDKNNYFGAPTYTTNFPELEVKWCSEDTDVINFSDTPSAKSPAPTLTTESGATNIYATYTKNDVTYTSTKHPVKVADYSVIYYTVSQDSDNAKTYLEIPSGYSGSKDIYFPEQIYCSDGKYRNITYIISISNYSSISSEISIHLGTTLTEIGGIFYKYRDHFNKIYLAEPPEGKVWAKCSVYSWTDVTKLNYETQLADPETCCNYFKSNINDNYHLKLIDDAE